MSEFSNSTDFAEGQTIFLNKPLYWTSFNLVKRVKNIILSTKKYNKKIKVGHAGTLDPLANGLMIICTGKSTKTINNFQNLDKEYIATIKLGETTPSFDLETEINNKYDFEHITKSLLLQTIKNLSGEQMQVPPAFSAVSVDGKRAYDMARNGEDVKIEAKRVIISDIELLEFDLPVVKVRIACSKGTYIRSFARDLGIALQSGGHLIGLQRTRIGSFKLEDAISIDDFEQNVKLLN